MSKQDKILTEELEQVSGGAFPTAVNDQITDAVTQANLKVLGDAPALALGRLYVATGQALANAAHNATTSQQQATVTMQASTTQSVSTLLNLETINQGTAVKKILES